MSENKQTAIEWLVEKLEIFATEEEMNIIEQAKAMEKDQIVKASAIAYEDMFGSDGTKYGETYYNETFKSE